MSTPLENPLENKDVNEARTQQNKNSQNKNSAADDSSSTLFQLVDTHELSDLTTEAGDIGWKAVVHRRSRHAIPSTNGLLPTPNTKISASTKKDNRFSKGKVQNKLSSSGLPNFKAVDRDKRGFSINIVINEQIINADTATKLIAILDSEDWEKFHAVNLLTFFDRLNKIYNGLLKSLELADTNSAVAIEEDIDLIFSRLHDKEYWEEISSTVAEFLPEFGARDLSHFARYIVIFEIKDKELLRKIADQAMLRLDEFSPRDLSEMTLSFAKVGFCPPVCKKIAKQLLVSNCDGFNEIDFSQIFSAYIRLSKLDPSLKDFLDELSKRTSYIKELDVSGLVTVMSGMASIKKIDKTFFNTVATRALVLIKKLDQHELTVILWSMASSQNFHLELVQNILKEVLAAIQNFEHKNLALLAWSVATLKSAFPLANIPYVQVFKDICKRVLQLKNFEPQYLSNLVWAFATLGISHEQLFNNIAHEAIAIIEDESFIDNQTVTNLAWAFAKAKIQNERLFQAVVKNAENNFKTFCPLQIAMLIWALGKNRQNFPSNLKAYEIPLLTLMAPYIESLDLHAFTHQNISNFMWGLSRFEIYHEPLIKKVIEHILNMKKEWVETRQSGKFKSSVFISPQHISNMMGALARLKVDHKEAMVSLVDIALDVKLENYSAINIAEMLWALATLRIEHKPFFRTVFAKIIVFPSTYFDITSLAIIAWSCAVFDLVDDKLFATLKNHIELRKSEMRIAECDQIYHFWQFLEMKNIALFSRDFKEHLKKMMYSVPQQESSNTHRSVAAVLRTWAKNRTNYKYHIENEYLVLGFFGDILMEEQQGNQTLRFLIEVMGEDIHYTKIHNKLIGHNHLKKRLLEAQNFIWIEIPTAEWHKQSNQLHYLNDKISAAKRCRGKQEVQLAVNKPEPKTLSIARDTSNVAPNNPAKTLVISKPFKLNPTAEAFVPNTEGFIPNAEGFVSKEFGSDTTFIPPQKKITRPVAFTYAAIAKRKKEEGSSVIHAASVVLNG